MTPATIRALLDGITAGEWELYSPDAYGGQEIHFVQSSATGRFLALGSAFRKEDAALFAAARGIARYALDLAAENERLFEAIRRQHRYLCADWPEGKHRSECLLYEVGAALAPQPTPTDGVE